MGDTAHREEERHPAPSSASATMTSSAAASAYRNYFDRYESTTEPSSRPDATSSSLPSSSSSSSPPPSSSDRHSSLMSFLASQVIGSDLVLDSPFGARPLLYADWTASGRALRHVEQFIAAEVLTSYGNTHTSSSYTGLQTSLFRKEARDIIGRECGASKDDVVLFAGSGSTGAMTTLLNLLRQQWKDEQVTPADVVLLVGPYQHHSVLLPLREMGCTLREIDEDVVEGGVDLVHLRAELCRYAARRVKVAFFSAASNISGVLQDTESVAALCHEHGALNVWDYATAAPYLPIDMNPRRQSRYAKDAILLSPHKMLGGLATPGVLLVKKRLMVSERPSTPAGGTVFFVSPSHHRYLENFEEREEGGTPDIVGAIRAGLTFQLKGQVDAQWRMERLNRYSQVMRQRLSEEQNVILVGHATAARLPIFSFLIRHSSTGLYLHPTFVSTLLNDLFGIQSRSGCMCAGPYAFQCLGLTREVAAALESALMRRMEIARPGFTRLNCHYTTTDADVHFMCDAVLFIAREGWKLLPLYGFHADSGEWRHRQRMTRMRERRWMANLHYTDEGVKYQHTTPQPVLPSLPLPALRRSMLEEAASAARSAEVSALHLSAGSDDRHGGMSDDCRQLRWFLLPAEAIECMRATSTPSTTTHSITPHPNVIQPPQSVEAVRALQAEWKKDTPVEEERKEGPSTTQPLHSNQTNSGSFIISPSSSTFSSPLSCPPSSSSSSPPSLLHSLRLEEDEERQQRAKRAAEHKLDRETNKHSKITAEAQISSCPLPPPQSAAPSSSSSSSSLPPSSGVCRHCFHRHYWSSHQKQCMSCSCITFEPLNPTSFSTSASTSSSSLPPATPLDPRAGDTASPLLLSSSSTAGALPAVRPVAVSRELSGLTKKLRSLVGRAIQDYAMIVEGDRVLVGVSGGKDSLTLIHILLALQAKSPVKFKLGAVTVDPQTPEYDPSHLKAYFASIQLPYFYESQPIIATARSCMLTPAKEGKEGKVKGKVSICSFCARMKRGLLYTTLRREGWNVLALGQHADDLCESLLMSTFHNGLLRTMKANYLIGAGDLRVIRPLIYTRERLTRQFALLSDLPVLHESCPACFEPPKERQRIKEILAQQETRHPNIVSNMLRAMTPLIAQSTAKAAGSGGGAAGSSVDVDEDDDV